MPDPSASPSVILRAVFVLIGLGLWYLTQALLKYRPDGTGYLGDGLHSLTAGLNRYLLTHPRAASVLLAVSSLCIDLLGGFVLAYGIFGPSFRPFVGLLIIFFLRQVCQALCALPPPEGMIWRTPGVPTLLVTYGTANDLFFSGHTALAVYGSIELARWGGFGWAIVGVIIGVFEVVTVIVLRAHYTLDVFAGAMTAFAAAIAADWIAPSIDRGLISLTASMGLG